MVKKTKKDTKDNIGGEAEANAPLRTEESKTEEVHDDQALKLQEKVKEAADNYDRYLRAVAELDNYKKRAVKDKADAIKYGNETLIKDLLPLVDNIDRALKHAETSCDFEAFKKGLAMLHTQLVCSLEKHGVEAIDCANKAFDPHYHEALMQVASTDHETNQIVDELEKGYLLNGRLLRPSKVSVCKRPDCGNQ
ncbi:MAG: nucleotide exchange factor GrpE [Syntrophales bacterium]